MWNDLVGNGLKIWNLISGHVLFLEDNLPSLLSFAYLDQSQIVTDITGKGSPVSFLGWEVVGGWGGTFLLVEKQF